MRKFVLVMGLLLSVNTFATTVFPHFLKTSLQSNHSTGIKTSLVYGGQDISRQRIATANESMKLTDNLLVG